MADIQPLVGLAPLKITCTSTDCDNGLHCFRSKKRKGATSLVSDNSCCRSCGEDLVDWKRIRSRELNDVTYTFQALKYEFIRHHFWHVEVDKKAIDHARRKGIQGMIKAAETRIRTSVGPENPGFDGRQTPKVGNVLFYAQHATATCCRKCIQEWHGISIGKALTEEQITYFSALTMLYVRERMPDLTETGEKIPSKRAIRASDDTKTISMDLEYEILPQRHLVATVPSTPVPKPNASKGRDDNSSQQLSLLSLEDVT